MMRPPEAITADWSTGQSRDERRVRFLDMALNAIEMSGPRAANFQLEKNPAKTCAPSYADGFHFSTPAQEKFKSDEIMGCWQIRRWSRVLPDNMQAQP